MTGPCSGGCGISRDFDVANSPAGAKAGAPEVEQLLRRQHEPAREPRPSKLLGAAPPPDALKPMRPAYLDCPPGVAATLVLAALFRFWAAPFVWGRWTSSDLDAATASL